METVELSWGALMGLIFGPTAGAWFAANRAAFRGVQAAINGTKDAVKRIEVYAEQNHEEIRALRDDVIRLQGRHDAIENTVISLRREGCTQLHTHLSVLRDIEKHKPKK